MKILLTLIVYAERCTQFLLLLVQGFCDLVRVLGGR